MTAQQDILNRLLDKYEHSKHLTEPGTSRRRVMLSTKKKELPGYAYENASVRDAYHAAAQNLEQSGLVTLEWLENHLLLTCIALNLDQIPQCYRLTGRTHPADRGAAVSNLITENLKDITVPWIKAWGEETCTKAKNYLQVPAFCKENLDLLKDILVAFREYDTLQESVTMRAFSSKCFHDTKYFERNVRDLFLRIARQYDASLSIACGETSLGERDQLAILGIYARPELYELAGCCILETPYGKIDVGAAPLSGLAIPSTLVDKIVRIDLSQVDCITFIENKTNYDEYLLMERTERELVVYHGGFMSPQKQKFFALLAKTASSKATVRFWADIDLGGFQMFQQMLVSIPQLQSMRMDDNCVEKYQSTGLTRSEEYLSKLKMAFDQNTYPLFSNSIAAILKYGVTIEQEAFLN